MSATSLRLRVTAEGTVRADLTFPVGAAARLHELMPPDVAAQLTTRGIDAKSVSERVVASGFPAGDLFTLDSGPKQVRVWLE